MDSGLISKKQLLDLLLVQMFALPDLNLGNLQAMLLIQMESMDSESSMDLTLTKIHVAEMISMNKLTSMEEIHMLPILLSLLNLKTSLATRTIEME